MGCVVLFHFANENLTLPKKQPDHVDIRLPCQDLRGGAHGPLCRFLLLPDS